MYFTSYVNPNIQKHQLEGVGSLYQRIVSCLALAKRHNVKYIHIPMRIGHNYNNDPEWDEKWDNMFNVLKLSYNHEIDINNIEKDNNINNIFPLDNYSPTTLYHYHNWKLLDFFDEKSHYYLENIQEQLIDAYDENNKHRKLIHDTTKINIAIHVRVYNDYDDDGSLSNYEGHAGARFNYNCEMYIKLINNIKEKYQNSDIHIFSQEKYFDLNFKGLRDIANIHFDDLDVFDTFHHLCKADVLVLGLSSFSTLAGYYNKNTVIYLKYYTRPALNSWIVYNE